MLVVTVCASAQRVISCNGDVAKVDMDNDGKWDIALDVSRVPRSHSINEGGNFNNELGRCYAVDQWEYMNNMGMNPENSQIPNPASRSDFSQYALVYSRFVSIKSYGYGINGGMFMPMTCMPNQASIAIGGRNFGFQLSIPVGNSAIPGYYNNASVGVNIGGNYVGASIPASVFTKKARQQRTPSTATRRTVVAPQSTTRSNNVNTVPTRVVEMSVDEVAQMLNSGSYM